MCPLSTYSYGINYELHSNRTLGYSTHLVTLSYTKCQRPAWPFITVCYAKVRCFFVVCEGTTYLLFPIQSLFVMCRNTTFKISRFFSINAINIHTWSKLLRPLFKLKSLHFALLVYTKLVSRASQCKHKKCEQETNFWATSPL